MALADFKEKLNQLKGEQTFALGHWLGAVAGAVLLILLLHQVAPWLFQFFFLTFFGIGCYFLDRLKSTVLLQAVVVFCAFHFGGLNGVLDETVQNQMSVLLLTVFIFSHNKYEMWFAAGLFAAMELFMIMQMGASPLQSLVFIAILGFAWLVPVKHMAWLIALVVAIRLPIVLNKYFVLHLSIPAILLNDVSLATMLFTVWLLHTKKFRAAVVLNFATLFFLVAINPYTADSHLIPPAQPSQNQIGIALPPKNFTKAKPMGIHPALF